MRKKGIELGKEKDFEFILTIFHPFHLVPKAAVSCGKELEIPVIVKIDDAVYQKAKGIKSIQRKIEKIYNTKTLQNATKVLVSNQNTKDLSVLDFKTCKFLPSSVVFSLCGAITSDVLQLLMEFSSWLASVPV